MSFYSPGGESANINPDGTWIEPECFAYPGDTFTRRAYVNMPDGSKKVVLCKCADTYFSVPATARVKGKTLRGFITGDENGLTFTPYKES